MHQTDASSKWIQLWLLIPLWGHCNNSDSDPVQNTLSNQIGPVPSPKKANDKAVPVIVLISLVHNSCQTVFKHGEIRLNKCATKSKKRGEVFKNEQLLSYYIYIRCPVM